MRIHFSWEDGGVAGIEEATCSCGATLLTHKDSVSDGDVITCEKCGAQIKFFWVGMEWGEINGPLKEEGYETAIELDANLNPTGRKYKLPIDKRYQGGT